MKVKCVSNIPGVGCFEDEISEYITPGKIYEIDMRGGILAGVITDDDGKEIIILLQGCAHGQWEVVE